MDNRELQDHAKRLVEREVMCCMSGLVATLAKGYTVTRDIAVAELDDLAEQAFELSSPVLDYEEAAIQAGWYKGVDGWTKDTPRGGTVKQRAWTTSAELACQTDGLEPIEAEVYEHWAVSKWLAEQLQAKGQRVDLDFQGLCVWGRITTGQAIYADAVMLDIARELHAPTSAAPVPPSPVFKMGQEDRAKGQRYQLLPDRGMQQDYDRGFNA